MYPYWKEIRSTLSLAGPIIMGQIGMMAMLVIDTAMVGRVGVIPLAAAAFSGSLFSVILVAGFGLCVAVHVLVAQAFGAGHQERCGLLLVHGVVVILIYAIICACGIQTGIGLLGSFGQSPAVVAQAQPYMVLLGWSLVPTLVYQCFKNFSEAQNQPWLPFRVLCGAIIIKVFLNWVFIFGRLGFPAWGLNGAGLSTLIVRVCMLGALVFVVIRSRHLAIAGLRWSVAGLRAAYFRNMLGIGIPTSLQIIFDVGAMTVVSIMMGWLSARWLAAHQIANQLAALAFMVPLGMSFAVAIRVGHAVGRKDRAAIRHIGFSATGFAVCFMSGCALFLFLMRNFLPGLFIEDNEVVLLASQLLVVAALFQVFDGIQIVCMGALRGLADVKVPTVLIFCVYWGICLPVGYVLAFNYGYQGLGLWLGQLLGLAIVAFFLASRFALITRNVPAGVIVAAEEGRSL